MIKDAKGLIRILISLSIIEFWSASIIRIAEGLQNYLLVRIIESVKWILRAGFIVIATAMGYGLAGIGAAYLASRCVNPDCSLSCGLRRKQQLSHRHPFYEHGFF